MVHRGEDARTQGRRCQQGAWMSNSGRATGSLPGRSERNFLTGGGGRSLAHYLSKGTVCVHTVGSLTARKSSRADPTQ